MISFTKILTLPLVMLAINCNNCYSSNSRDTSDSSYIELDSDEYNEYINNKIEENRIEHVDEIQIAGQGNEMEHVDDIAIAGNEVQEIDPDKYEDNNNEIKNNKLTILKQEFDRAMTLIEESEFKIMNQFPQCEETEKILRLITKFKESYYLPAMKYNNGVPIEYTYLNTTKVLQQFLHENFKYEELYNKNTHNSSMQLNSEQEQIIKYLISFCTYLFNMYAQMAGYSEDKIKKIINYNED